MNALRQGLGRFVAAGILVGVAAPADAACSVNAQAVSFGAYDTLSSMPLDGVGNVTVNCDLLTTFTVSLSAGSGSYDERLMAAGGAQLSYNLYTDATRLFVWGDGTSGSSVVSGAGSADLTVYGRIPALQNVQAGTYADSIIVTVTY